MDNELWRKDTEEIIALITKVAKQLGWHIEFQDVDFEKSKVIDNKLTIKGVIPTGKILIDEKGEYPDEILKDQQGE